MQRLAPGHPETLALADGEVLDAVVPAHHGAVDQHDLALPRRQVGVEEGPHRTVVIRQAEVLALGLGGGAQAPAGGLGPGVLLGQFAQGEHQPIQLADRQVIEEIALILVRIEAAQQLGPAAAIARHRQGIGCVAGPHTGVVAGGDARDAPLAPGPLQHRAELDVAVAAGAGQRRDSLAVALHQEINDLRAEVLAEIDHVMGHAQLLAQGGCIHQAFGAAGALAAHQPQREPLHLPAGRRQQCGGEGAVDAAGQAHRHPLLARPVGQALQHRLHRLGRFGGHGARHRQAVSGRGDGVGARGRADAGMHRWSLQADLSIMEASPAGSSCPSAAAGPHRMPDTCW